MKILGADGYDDFKLSAITYIVWSCHQYHVADNKIGESTLLSTSYYLPADRESVVYI
jgi:hypothetical protein